jgi:hypothetical protein
MELTKIEINAITGEITEIALTDAEIKERQKNEKRKIEELKANEAREIERQAILDRLGLTSDEAKLLLG